MDEWVILAPIILLISIAVCLAIPVFFIWLAVSKSRKLYRQKTRRHLYVPVMASVHRVWFSDGFNTLWVTYNHAGKKLENRFTVFDLTVARTAKECRTIDLLIDPDYPYDVVVAS